jgi:hypothetical protein
MDETAIEAAARSLYEKERGEMTFVDTDKYGQPVYEPQWDHEHPEIKAKYIDIARHMLGE